MRLRERKGGLLIEILISAILIGLVGAGVLGMLSINRQFSVRSRHKIEALNFVREKIERFESMSYEAIEALSDNSDTVTFSNGTTATRAWTFTDVDWDEDLAADAKQINVKVTW